MISSTENPRVKEVLRLRRGRERRASGAFVAEGPREVGRALAKAAPRAKGVKVWGPTPAFYHLLRGQTRERLLVQAERSVDVQAYLRAWLDAVKLLNAVRVQVDVDPVSFF